MIKLYIADKLVDLTDDLTILLSRTRTDYTNPTIVKNSFSKTITIPNTINNNQIFTNIWKLDRVQNPTQFNPSKRVPFNLLIDNELVESGYVKLDNIARSGDFYQFDITLFGELGNLLYSLTYLVDEDTYDEKPANLSMLDFGFDSITINKDVIKDAWDRLGGDTSKPEIYDTINFVVSYDGIPKAKNFDADKMWVSTRHTAKVIWNDTTYDAGNFPSEITSEGTVYKAQPEVIFSGHPNDKYGLMEMPESISPLEARDFRSYLLRPAINIKKLFEAIGRYVEEKYDFHIDMSDPFFSSSEFNNLWVTLSKLDKVMPEVESNSVITKDVLFSTTSSPSSYLISLCKIYGIYIDADVNAPQKTLRLNRLPNFFTDEVLKLEANTDKKINISPLSFDKASYTFDYADGEGEFINAYKEKYGVKYGSKFINTGYNFDSSTAQYIQNNVFKNALDSIDQSIYYRYNMGLKGGSLYNYPAALANYSGTNTYKLFNTTSGEVEDFAGDMYNVFDGYANSGYQFINEKWIGLRPEIWQDSFPKLQLHGSDNDAEEGKDVLISFNGFLRTKYGSKMKTEAGSIIREGDDYVKYLISDDNQQLKRIIGKNCYYDNQYPDTTATRGQYLIQIDSIPSFSRAKYNYADAADEMPVYITHGFDTYTTGGSGLVSVTSGYNNIRATFPVNTVRQYPYISVSGIKENHRYAIFAGIQSTDPTPFLSGENNYLYPEIAGGEVISHKDLGPLESLQLTGSIVNMGQFITIPTTRLRMPSSVNNLRTGEYSVLYVVVYDLTELGLDFNNINDVINYFGITPQQLGYKYGVEETLDFAVSREIYVPSVNIGDNISIYDRYWKSYIADLYSINTRIIEVYTHLEDLHFSFKKFYWFDDTLWILSSVTDWNPETKKCKAKFIKVNDKTNYLR